MKGWIFILFLAGSVSAMAQSERKYIREGNRQYGHDKFSEAEISYRKAMDKNPKSFEAGFNIGNSLYKEGKYPEAANQFNTLIQNEKNKDHLNKLYYNLGNSLLKGRKLGESIDAYKNALINTPTDMDSKYNLLYAMKLMKQQKDKDKQDNKKDKDKDKNKDKDKDKDKDKNGNKNKDQDKDQKNDKNKQPPDKNKQMSQEDAQRMLDALQNDENELEKKLKEQKAVREKTKVLKNW